MSKIFNSNGNLSKKMISKFPTFYILLNRKNGIKDTIITIRGYKAIKKHNLLDVDIYLENNSDVRLSGMDPIIHYLYYGYEEGRDPNPSFDMNYCFNKDLDIKYSKLNPLVYYSLYGIKDEQKIQEMLNQITILKKLLEEEITKHKGTENKLRKLESEITKIQTLPDFENLKRTLKGENGYLFLINDSNNEIRQHFDYTYFNNFNAKFFTKFLNYKKNFCRNSNIKYYFFLTPDKALVCKEFLPFETKLIKRNHDLIKHIVPDFLKNLDPTCYFKTDTHINYEGGKELSYFYLNNIDNNFKIEDFERLINEQVSICNRERVGDLLGDINWSYPSIEKEEYLNEKTTLFRNNCLIDLKEKIPEEFKFEGRRETEYYKNESGFTDLRVLIFRDSMSHFLKDALSVYFKEILLHWDHWSFPEELIRWYKPDIILEIRVERFLENIRYELIKMDENLL